MVISDRDDWSQEYELGSHNCSRGPAALRHKKNSKNDYRTRSRNGLSGQSIEASKFKGWFDRDQGTR